jgi:hypothetical protein
MPSRHFPARIQELPPFEGPFEAFRLQARGCDVLFASYPAGTTIAPHSHDTENCGVTSEGELILITAGSDQRFGPGTWYRLAPARSMQPASMSRHQKSSSGSVRSSRAAQQAAEVTAAGFRLAGVRARHQPW